VYGANFSELIVHSFWIETMFEVFALLQNSSLYEVLELLRKFYKLESIPRILPSTL
jgi:hypothetical protein